MSRRKEKVFGFGSRSEGLTLTITRKGIELSGYYNSIVGLEGGFVSWDDLEKAKREVFEVSPRPYEELV